LDYFLLSNNLISFVKNVLIENSYRSDHSGVVISLILNPVKKGRGLWKFNNSLLIDKDYVTVVKEIINKVTRQYAVPVYNFNNLTIIPNDELQFVINSQLFLDTLLMEIRGKTIAFSAYKKKKYNELEQKICDEIKALEEDENTFDLEGIESKKKDLLELRKEKLKGHYIRSRSKWIEEGEKPSKYFCNLESRNYYSKLITKLQLENGKEINDQDEILKETKTFYQNLYSAPSEKNSKDITEIMSQLRFSSLTDKEAEELEGEITYLEVLTVLKNMSRVGWVYS
jgi:polyhydroxyalkanoate synthesis regulator phasin